MKLKSSVVIPCYNGEKHIDKCIESFLNQTKKPDEIIIVDDGSEDKSMKIAKKYPVKIIKHERNQGLAKTRNTGIKTAKHDIIIFIDADCIADRNLVKNILKNYNSEKIAGVGGWGMEVNSDGLANKYRSIHGVQGHGNRKKKVNGLFGLCFSFRKKVFEEVGLFDADFRTNGEDVDMGFRITDKGYKLIYDPEIKVSHLRYDKNVDSYKKTIYNYFYYGSLAHLKNKNHANKWLVKAIIKIFLRNLRNMLADLLKLRLGIFFINALSLKEEMVSALRVYKFYIKSYVIRSYENNIHKSG